MSFRMPGLEGAQKEVARKVGGKDHNGLWALSHNIVGTPETF